MYLEAQPVINPYSQGFNTVIQMAFGIVQADWRVIFLGPFESGGHVHEFRLRWGISDIQARSPGYLVVVALLKNFGSEVCGFRSLYHHLVIDVRGGDMRVRCLVLGDHCREDNKQNRGKRGFLRESRLKGDWNFLVPVEFHVYLSIRSEVGNGVYKGSRKPEVLKYLLQFPMEDAVKSSVIVVGQEVGLLTLTLLVLLCRSHSWVGVIVVMRASMAERFFWQPNSLQVRAPLISPASAIH